MPGRYLRDDVWHESDTEPGGIRGQLEVPGKIGQLLDLRWHYGGLSHLPVADPFVEWKAPLEKSDGLPVDLGTCGLGNIMATESQTPHGFRRVKRWQLALRTWGLTTLVVGAIGTLALMGIEWAVAGHALHQKWELALIAFGVSAAANIPLALRVLREYPVPKHWK